jgi:hypothetical protein
MALELEEIRTRDTREVRRVLDAAAVRGDGA